MRKTVNLDDDVHELVSAYAAARGITLGSAIGELIRSSRETPSPPVGFTISANGLALFPSQGRTLTPEMVKAASEDEIDGN